MISKGRSIEAAVESSNIIVIEEKFWRDWGDFGKTAHQISTLISRINEWQNEIKEPADDRLEGLAPVFSKVPELNDVVLQAENKLTAVYSSNLVLVPNINTLRDDFIKDLTPISKLDLQFSRFKSAVASMPETMKHVSGVLNGGNSTSVETSTKHDSLGAWMIALIICAGVAIIVSIVGAVLSLIRYTTKVLDTILLNQDKNFRPVNPDNSPLQVEVDISVRSMGPISEQNMEFSLDCYFRQKWLDRRLAFTPINPSKPEIPLASKMLKDIWVPDTYIRNGRKSYLHTLTVPNILFRVRSDGQVHVSQRLTIRSRCQMFLKKFPMDTQACPIEVGSLGYFSKDVIYKWKEVELDSKMGNMLSQYQVLSLSKSERNVSDFRFSDRNISVLNVYFKLQRQQGYYILQIYTPCTLVVVMSWVSFWINKEASPARVSLGIMTVLSMSTIGFGLRTDLPKVSHSTALDVYILSCFVFLFAAMVEYAVINYAQIVYIRKQVHDLKGLEQNSAMGQMRMFTAGLMGARRDTIQVDDLAVAKEEARLKAVPWWKKLCNKDEQGNTSVFYRMAVKAAIAKKTLRNGDPAEVVNKIDNFSKWAFPTLYIIFNVFYWVAYLHLIPDEIDSLPNISGGLY